MTYMRFKQYISNEEKKDINDTLEKIPAKHSKLVRGYEISFQPSNCLKGDKGHIGFIDEENKKIVIASPWNYGREYTLLHEVGHAVWKYILKDNDKAEWKKTLDGVRAKNKKELSQNDEEIFCMCYAQHYAKNKLCKYDHKELDNFVSKI
jgi:hypothetical protein